MVATPYEFFMSLVWMSHVAHVNESCRTYEWVTSRMNESCYIWMSHESSTVIARRRGVSTSCHGTRELSHGKRRVYLWIIHVTHINASWHTYKNLTDQVMWLWDEETKRRRGEEAKKQRGEEAKRRNSEEAIYTQNRCMYTQKSHSNELWIHSKEP